MIILASAPPIAELRFGTWGEPHKRDMEHSAGSVFDPEYLERPHSWHNTSRASVRLVNGAQRNFTSQICGACPSVLV